MRTRVIANPAGGTRARTAVARSAGPLVSPVLTAAAWEAQVVPMREENHLLLFTDSVWEPSQTRMAVGRTVHERDQPGCDGGAALLDTLLADVHHELAGQLQADEFTLLTASRIGATDRKRSE